MLHFVQVDVQQGYMENLVRPGPDIVSTLTTSASLLDLMWPSTSRGMHSPPHLWGTSRFDFLLFTSLRGCCQSLWIAFSWLRVNRGVLSIHPLQCFCCKAGAQEHPWRAGMLGRCSNQCGLQQQQLAFLFTASLFWTRWREGGCG